tara:strand:+ start:748 stop:993 length:246 start_codon:yes stop_codon:yes gene_type:complete
MTNELKQGIIETANSLNMKLDKVYERNGYVWIVVHSEKHLEFHDFNDWFCHVTTQDFKRPCIHWTSHGNRKNDTICTTFRV